MVDPGPSKPAFCEVGVFVVDFEGLEQAARGERRGHPRRGDPDERAHLEDAGSAGHLNEGGKEPTDFRVGHHHRKGMVSMGLVELDQFGVGWPRNPVEPARERVGHHGAIRCHDYSRTIRMRPRAAKAHVTAMSPAAARSPCQTMLQLRPPSSAAREASMILVTGFQSAK